MFFKELSLVTGGFDPIHSGHISYFKRAKDLSNYLVVGLNGDPWLKRKKGQYFQCWTERADIVRHLDMVDAVISYDDSDDSSCEGIAKSLEIDVIFGGLGIELLPGISDSVDKTFITYKELTDLI